MSVNLLQQKRKRKDDSTPKLREAICYWYTNIFLSKLKWLRFLFLKYPLNKRMLIAIRCTGVVTCQLQSLSPWLLCLKELVHNASTYNALGVSGLLQRQLVNNSLKG